MTLGIDMPRSLTACTLGALLGFAMSSAARTDTLAAGGRSAGIADANAAISKPEGKVRMWMTVGEHRFAIPLADNAAARALSAQLPLMLKMSELNGNEKYADLPTALPTDASRPGTIRAGDLMPYGRNDALVRLSQRSQSRSSAPGRRSFPIGPFRARAPNT